MQVRPHGTNERVSVTFWQAELSQDIGAESDAPSRTVKARPIRRPIGVPLNACPAGLSISAIVAGRSSHAWHQNRR